MQNTVDHTNVSDMASLLGAKYNEPKTEGLKQQACEQSCDLETK